MSLFYNWFPDLLQGEHARYTDMRIIEGKLIKPKQTAKPLADPDALVPDIPDHVQRPEIDPPKPVAVSGDQTKKVKRRIKAIKRRLRSHAYE